MRFIGNAQKGFIVDGTDHPIRTCLNMKKQQTIGFTGCIYNIYKFLMESGHWLAKVLWSIDKFTDFIFSDKIYAFQFSCLIADSEYDCPPPLHLRKQQSNRPGPLDGPEQTCGQNIYFRAHSVNNQSSAKDSVWMQYSQELFPPQTPKIYKCCLCRITLPVLSDTGFILISILAP